jgi:integrase
MITERKSIAEIAGLWKEDKKAFVKVSTYSAYLLILQNHILPYFGEMTDVREADVQAFAMKKLQDGLCQKSIKDILVVLKMIVRFGAKNGWCDYVEWDIRFPTVQEKPQLDVLSVGNHRKMLDYIQSHFTFKNLGIYICLTGGLRIGEVCALQWKDVDIERGVLMIRKTVERVYILDGDQRHTELLIGHPKTMNSVREVPMTTELYRMLKPFRKVVNPDFYLLTNEPVPTEPRTYRNYYKRLMEKLSIPQIKFHGLRHSFATRCIESNCDYKTVSVILGHSSINTTLNLYVHPNTEQKKKCIDKMFRAIR